MQLFDKPDWTREGGAWPLSSWSTFREAGGLRWHVQSHGSGPVCLLLHGTGAATHSWRDMAPRLAERFTVVAPDLPGHGFTATPRGSRLSLRAMARHVDALLVELGVRPALVVGHSAGAAIALRMALDGAIAPAGIVSLNGALRPFKGSAGPLFSVMAKALFLNPVAPHAFALGGRDKRRIERLLANTGSTLDDEGVSLYQRLFIRPGHVAGALAMMANWDLTDLMRDIGRLTPRLLLVVGDRDRAVPPEVANEVRRAVPGAQVVTMARLGHLAHEENPQAASAIVLAFARELDVLPTIAA